MINDSELLEPQNQSYWVVIPAAGIGSRMQSSIPKQYRMIEGYPILSHTLSQFLQHPNIAGVMVAIAAEDSNWKALRDTYKGINTEDNTANSLRFCRGGKTRMDSVLAALNALSEDIEPEQMVLVHDAARPGITQQVLNNFITEISSDSEANGYVLGQPATDTLKVTHSDNEIVSTLDRNKIWAAQTPQAFKYYPLRHCLETIQQQHDSSIFTDESSAMETSAIRIKMIAGNSGNFKITTADDISRMAFEIKYQLKNSQRVHPQQFFRATTELTENT